MEYQPSRHHIWYEHSRFKDNLGRKLRNQRGFVIPTNVLWHRELHAHLPSPAKPQPCQVHALLDILETVEHTGKYDVMNYTIDAFMDFSKAENGLETNALAIASNLLLQLDYLQYPEVSNGS